MKLEINDTQADLLRSILERHLGNLRSEIYRTENAAMRAGLKQDEAEIKAMLGRLAVPAA